MVFSGLKPLIPGGLISAFLSGCVVPAGGPYYGGGYDNRGYAVVRDTQIVTRKPYYGGYGRTVYPNHDGRRTYSTWERDRYIAETHSRHKNHARNDNRHHASDRNQQRRYSGRDDRNDNRRDDDRRGRGDDNRDRAEQNRGQNRGNNRQATQARGSDQNRRQQTQTSSNRRPAQSVRAGQYSNHRLANESSAEFNDRLRRAENEAWQTGQSVTAILRNRPKTSDSQK
ncbi:hypothetical protein KHP62_04515 [Rhodobacteraceae bacterium NNCM2]|nr:hypothetical protein [Coraliihabitans acroporae]